LNESKSKKSYELLQIVKYLKAELQCVKEDNERILKAQEELNHILLRKIHNQENDIIKVSESDIGTVSYKHKGNKLKFSDYESNSSKDNRIKKEKYNYSSESSDNSPKRKKNKPYEEISGEFKKIRPPTFNGEIEKGEEAESWLLGMKNYFQIYNYSDELKERMAIYNLTAKANIWCMI